jgi:hypothetical protein
LESGKLSNLKEKNKMPPKPLCICGHAQEEHHNNAPRDTACYHWNTRYLGYCRCERFRESQEETRKAAITAAAPRLLNALQELSAWMRAHTGPGDGTHEMLCRAVEAIKATGEPLRDDWGA